MESDIMNVIIDVIDVILQFQMSRSANFNNNRDN